MYNNKISADVNERLPHDCRIHILEGNQTCGEGEDGDICIVRWGEHRPISIDEAEAWIDALQHAVDEAKKLK